MQIPFFSKLFLKDLPDKKEAFTQKARIVRSSVEEYFKRQPTLTDIYQMRQDPTIKIGLSVIKHPLQRVDWDITSEDPAVKNLVRDNLREFWNEFMVNLLTAISFGYSIHEKKWGYKNSYLIYERLVPLRPDSIQLYYDPLTGDLTRIKQSVSYNIDDKKKTPEMKKAEKDGIEILADKLFIYSHEKEFGNIEGESRLSGVYAFWKMCDDIYRYANTFYHRYSIPPIRAWAPEGETIVGTDAQGNQTREDNITWWTNIISNIHEVTHLVHQWTPNDEWGLEFMETKTQGIDFLPYIEHLNVMKLLALFVPELAVMRGSKGSYGLGKEQTELFLDNEEAILREIKGQIDKDLIKPLVQFNFPPTYTGREAPLALWTFAPISKQVRAYTSKIFQLLTNALGNRGISFVDYKELGERLGIPVLPEPEYLLPTAESKTEKPEEEEARMTELGLAEREVRQWRKKIDKMIKGLSSRIKEVYDLQIEKVMLRTKEILEKQKSKAGSLIRNIRIPLEGKLANTIYVDSLKAFDFGKKSASKELNVTPDPTVPDNIRNSLKARSEAVANRHANDILYIAAITVLDQLYENVTNKDIISMLADEFEKFQNKKIGVTASTELMNSFSIGRSYVAEQHIIK